MIRRHSTAALFPVVMTMRCMAYVLSPEPGRSSKLTQMLKSITLEAVYLFSSAALVPPLELSFDDSICGKHVLEHWQLAMLPQSESL